MAPTVMTLQISDNRDVHQELLSDFYTNAQNDHGNNYLDLTFFTRPHYGLS